MTDEVRAAVEAARAAQPIWGALPLSERRRATLALARRILEKRAEGATVLAEEMGRNAMDSLLSEIVGVVEFAKAAGRAADRALAPERIRLSPLDYPKKRLVVERIPRGVVGIIAPWNYPLANFYKALFPALLAGNGVVLKPSEHTPEAGTWLAARCAEILPKGLVGLAQGPGAVGEALADVVDALVFTGSVRTGRKVAVRAAERLVPCSVELGGKDAAIVLADCDLERTALGVVQWGMHNAGQNCAGIERVYVEETIADALLERMGRIASALRVGTDLGAMQNEMQLGIVEAHVAQARAKGARLVCGGKRTGRGLGYEPTILDACADDMKVVREETFGPVLAVLRVRDAEEAIARANASSYGLNGSVWTRDLARGEAIARRLDVGVALVNNHALTGILAESPWTGTKDTGTGIASSRHAYPTFTRLRSVFVDASTDPDPWWMPLDDTAGAFADAIAERSLGSFGALFKLARLLKSRLAAIRRLGERVPAVGSRSRGGAPRSRR
jgi:acyl-CoA reductase-like NAD-dependent aldehyde dehydrogenase